MFPGRRMKPIAGNDEGLTLEGPAPDADRTNQAVRGLLTILRTCMTVAGRPNDNS